MVVNHEFDPRIGRIVEATIHVPNLDPDRPPKKQPALLVHTVPGGAWRVMTFTRARTFADGAPRQRIPHHGSHYGLPEGPWHLWGDRLTKLPDRNIGAQYGWADRHLAELVTRTATMNPRDAEVLTAQAVLAQVGALDNNQPDNDEDDDPDSPPAAADYLRPSLYTTTSGILAPKFRDAG